MGMSVLPNFITWHGLCRSMHDSCLYLSYLDTCLAWPLFSITNLENNRLQYPHVQPQCSFIVIILFQVTFGWEFVAVRSWLDGITESLRHLQNTKSASGSKQLQVFTPPAAASALNVVDSGLCKRSMASNPTKCILVVYEKRQGCRSASPSFFRKRRGCWLTTGIFVIYRKTTGVRGGQHISCRS